MSLEQTNFPELEARFQELELELQNPELAKNQKLYSASAKRHTELGRLLSVWHRIKKTEADLEDAKVLLTDPSPDFRELAEGEIETLNQTKADLENELKVLLLPKDPNDDKNTIFEIRAATGGDEASLFAADLYRMYSRYAESMGWRTDVLSSSPNGVGGYKEIVFSVEGQRVYSHLKYESGVHRVQRVPATETMGRIHTSTITVAVLPEAEEVEIELKNEDIRVDVYRSSGPGGQSVNTTDSAVRVTHIPTGLTVAIQDEKSQLKNKVKALKILRARLLDRANAEQSRKISSERREQVGTGERNERIRTYNYLQGRLTDHRVGLTVYRLPEILNGDLGEVISEIAAFFQAKLLASAEITS
ncbi:MAG: peptide chain release factor 1 [Deltaproteobacteria bacterium]|jgi:peptide chain release factor 1|nr:peptide chain release factor 1 [Deltaproteobacteria bacterium]